MVNLSDEALQVVATSFWASIKVYDDCAACMHFSLFHTFNVRFDSLHVR